MKIFEVEQKDPYKVAAELIMANCGPFLRQIKYLKRDILFRGIRGLNVSKVMNKLPCPTNRLPLDTAMDIHLVADDWFFHNTGIRYRSNAIFCTGDRYVTSGYGDPCAVFPIGEFSFCYSNTIGDMTNTIGDLKNDVATREGTLEVHKILNRGRYKQNTDLRRALKSHSEIMVHCVSYYAIPMIDDDTYINVIKHINRGMLG